MHVDFVIILIRNIVIDMVYIILNLFILCVVSAILYDIVKE